MHVCILANAHTDTHSRTVRDGLPSFNCHAFPHWPHLVAFLRETLVSLFTSKLCAWPADCTFTSPCYPATAALVLGPPEIHSRHRTQRSLKNINPLMWLPRFALSKGPVNLIIISTPLNLARSLPLDLALPSSSSLAPPLSGSFTLFFLLFLNRSNLIPTLGPLPSLVLLLNIVFHQIICMPVIQISVSHCWNHNLIVIISEQPSLIIQGQVAAHHFTP